MKSCTKLGAVTILHPILYNNKKSAAMQHFFYVNY